MNEVDRVDPLSYLVGDRDPDARPALHCAEGFVPCAESLIQPFCGDVALSEIRAQEQRLESVWKSGDRITVLKLVVACVSRLGVLQSSDNYPARAMQTIKLLERFACLLQEHVKAAGNKQNAEDVVDKWMTHIGLIRNPIPRLYLSLAMVPISTSPDVIRRLVRMSRCIADPVISAYTRMYASRYAPADSIIEALRDQIQIMYPRCDAGVLDRIQPAMAFMLNRVQHHSPAPFALLLGAYEDYSTDASLLSLLLSKTPPHVLVDCAGDVVRVIVGSHPISAHHLSSLLTSIARSGSPVSEGLWTSLRRVTFRIRSDQAVLQLSVLLTMIVMSNVVPWNAALFHQLYADICKVAQRRCHQPSVMAIMDVIVSSADSEHALAQTERCKDLLSVLDDAKRCEFLPKMTPHKSAI